MEIHVSVYLWHAVAHQHSMATVSGLDSSGIIRVAIESGIWGFQLH